MHQAVRKAVRHGQASQENVARRARVRCEPQNRIHYFFAGDYLGGFYIFLFFFFSLGFLKRWWWWCCSKANFCVPGELVGAGCYWEFGF